MAKLITKHIEGGATTGSLTVLTDLKVRPEIAPTVANSEFLSQKSIAKVKGGEQYDISKVVIQDYLDEKDGSQHRAIFYLIPAKGGYIVAQDNNLTKDTVALYAQTNPDGQAKWEKKTGKPSSGGGGGGGGGSSEYEFPSPESSSMATPIVLGLAAAAAVWFVALRK